MKVALLVNIIFIIAMYKYMSSMAGFPKNHIKAKEARKILFIYLMLIVGRELLPYIGVSNLFSDSVNDKISVGIFSLIIMYIGNLAPKIPNYNNICKNKSWAFGDEKVWKKATKIFGYISFAIGISMFVLSFYFESETVVIICQLIWLGIPSLYLFNYYNKKFTVR